MVMGRWAAANDASHPEEKMKTRATNRVEETRAIIRKDS
jgi:hypothetical protein